MAKFRRMVSRKLRAQVARPRKMRLLFSIKPEWEPSIREGLSYTPHEVVFDRFTVETVAQHDLVIPLTIEDIVFLDAHRSLISKHGLPIPSARSVAVCDDKVLFHEALVQGGFGHLMPAIGKVLPYPYILKKRQDAWGTHSYVIDNPKAEEELRDLADRSDFFRQELVPGTSEFASHVLFCDGQIRKSLHVRYDFGDPHPIKGKTKVLKMTCRTRCRYLDIFTDILTSIGFEGICCFNYKTTGNRLSIFEINPRFGGSLGAYVYTFVKYFERF